MEKVKEIKAAVAAIIAVLTALWGWLGWAVLLFLGSMALDYLTGSWAAIAAGEWSSARARTGLRGKLGEIVALLVAALCDIAVKVVLQSAAAPLLGTLDWRNYISMLVCAWYIFTEFGSIIENAGRLGAPIPEWLKKGIKALKGKVDEAAETAIEKDNK
ncbi:MAG: phage holin family protein [Oscillospiraceae bacterium]|jgi:toxin secretion/phage lysis holin|nr:phage holin family protein [Oscillospiraceae bacterium]